MRKGLFLFLVIGLLGVLAACGDDGASKEEEIEAFEEFQDDVEDLSLDTDRALMEYLELIDQGESEEGKRVLEEETLPLLEELIGEYEKLDFSYDVLADFTENLMDSIIYRKDSQQLILDHFNGIEAGESAVDSAVIDEIVASEDKSIDATVRAFEIAEENDDIEALQPGEGYMVESLTEEDKEEFASIFEQVFTAYEEGLK